MAYCVLSRNAEECFNYFLSPDPDPAHIRGGLSHGYNTSCVTKIKSIGAIFFWVTRPDVDIMHYPKNSSPRARVNVSVKHPRC